MQDSVVIIDKVDRNLLWRLDRNSRTSSTDLARELGIPEETVRFRVRRLFEKKVILSTLTVIDAGKLGYDYFKVLLKLQNIDDTKLKHLVDYLLEHPMVNWVASFDVLYDLAFTIRVRRIAELSLVLDELRKVFPKNIQSLNIAVNMEVDFLPRDYLVSKERKLLRKTSYTSPILEGEIDSINYGILRSLSDNSRQSSAEIGRKLQLSPETISRRILQLEKQGFIKAYRLNLTADRFGFLNYYVFLYLNLSEITRVKELIQHVRSLVNVTYVVKALGAWDYEFSLEVETTDQYRAIMMKLTSLFSDIVRDSVGIAVNRVYKLEVRPGD